MVEPSKFQKWIAEVPIAAWAFLIAQLLAMVTWAVQIDSRIHQIELEQVRQDARVDQIDGKGTRALQITDERQRINNERISELRRQMDWLIQMNTPHVAPPMPYQLQGEENK